MQHPLAATLAALVTTASLPLLAGEPGTPEDPAGPPAAAAPIAPDCDPRKFLEGVRGADVTERIGAYDAFVRACPDSPAAATLYEESMLLRELLARQLDEIADPPAPPAGAAVPRPASSSPVPAAPPPSTAPAPVPPAGTGGALVLGPTDYGEHEGLFFRLAAGASYFKGNYEGVLSGCPTCLDYAAFSSKQALSGPALGAEATVGYAFVPGLALGLRFSALLVAGWKMDDPALESKAFGLALVQPIVSWYPDPEDGFHLWIAPGAGFATVRDAGGQLPDDALKGFAISTGLGYEGWVGEDVGVGLELLIDGGYLSSSERGGTPATSLGFVAPGAALTVTLN
ncbi:MAG: hypothetical protein IT373_17940 [Polyangiaceae bacterium]|nr:hypothetical protein [Polyangiaceae bacterium]